MGRMAKVVMVVLGAVAPVVVLAPRSDKAMAVTVADLVRSLRATGLEGRAVVDAAMSRVAAEYSQYSLWHLWESPGASLARGRGWSHQYNTVLCEVLDGLGFDAHLVHAARVRGFRHPWWHAGHAWVKVVVDGRSHDACASRGGNTVDDVGFTPVTAEMAYRPVTRLGVTLALMPFVAVDVWRAWLTGHPVPPWVFRSR